MCTKSRGDENDPFANPGGRSSWSGTAQPPPPGPPLPPGSPGGTVGPQFAPAPTPPASTPPASAPPAPVPIGAPPGAYGYPPPPAGGYMYPPPPASSTWGASSAKNWMGITSLILACIGGGLLGIVFGHMGLVACKRGEANNRGVALAGVIVNYSMIGLLVMVLALVGVLSRSAPSATPTHTSGFATQNAEATQVPIADATEGHPLDTSLAISGYWYDLTIGECVSSFHASEPDASGEYPFQDPTVVPCSEPHYGEVYALATIGGTEASNDAVFQAHT